MGGGDALSVPAWLLSLPLAPEYHPTETEFADPIAFISRVERAAAAFGICKIVPPLPRPSKKLALANLNRSLLHSPDQPPLPAAPAAVPDAAVFTTRHQELGSRRPNKHVWQSGERYTLDQFEAKSRSFSRSQLAAHRDVTPLLVESLFWRANAEEKPISIEYANDVPGSGFSAPRRSPHRRKRQQCPEAEGPAAGQGLSDSPWNLQVIARAPGSLTRFMPDDVPGVTSPMVYIGMLYSWFAWHVEDHELHSLNFLHMGAPKTWYAVPGEYAGAMEEIVRMQGYGGNVDRLAALTMLGEKTNLLCPEVLVQAGIPCCRLVQHPGEFVVTFPRAYHVGFSHGFNCGEAANFATPQWLKVAKEAAVRRAAMNHLPMLSHQQLLYMLTMSFVFRIPRELILGVRSSRLRDRMKEEREVSIKKAFLNDLMNENYSLCTLLKKETTFGAVLWDPVLLPIPTTNVSQSFTSSSSPVAHSSVVVGPEGQEIDQCICKKEDHLKSEDTLENFDADGDDLPFGLNLDSGSLACVACGILGYPFMVIIQPSERAVKEICPVNCEPVNCEQSHPNLNSSGCSAPCPPSCLANTTRNSDSDYSKGSDAMLNKQGNPDSSCKFLPELSNHVPDIQGLSTRCGSNLQRNEVKESSFNSSFEEIDQNTGTMCRQVGSISSTTLDLCAHSTDDHSTAISQKMNPVNDCGNRHMMRLTDAEESMGLVADAVICNESSCTNCVELVDDRDKFLGAPTERSCDILEKNWNLSNGFLRPRVFCLQHAVEIEKLLQCKGGARVLIICYSDYLKIKPQAFAVAEEIGFQLNFNDVPMENASPADLDLINTSIDDEDYEENGEDWTSKLSLNLKYCLKLRKQSLSNQESPVMALNGIFSDLHPSSPVSRLKWHSRRTRTPKLYCSSQPTSCSNAGMGKDDSTVRKSETEIQVYQTCKSEAVEVTRKRRGRPRKGVPKELGNSTDTAEARSREDHRWTSTTASLVESSLENQETGVINNTLNDSIGVQENKIEADAILENSQDYSQSPKDLHVVHTLSVNETEMEVEVSDSEEPKVKAVAVDSLKSGMQSDNNYPEVAIQKAERASGREHNPSYAICSLQLDNQYRIDVSVTDSSMVEHSIPSLTLDSKGYNNGQLEGHLPSEEIFEGSGMQMNKGNVVSSVDNSVYVVNDISLSVVKSCEMQDIVKDKLDGNAISSQQVIERDVKRPTIVYTRRAERNKNKRKREELIPNGQDCCERFIRSPCEGLRPRSGRTLVEYEITARITKKTDSSAVRRGNDNGAHKCNIEGCHLSFRTRGELKLHRSNFCIFKGCRKRFSSHTDVVRHHQVHEAERPFKCPWEGCGMSFKWAWARTEHLRLHTGERPYQCKAAGCGQTFMFMSDFSRHRRKTGHSVDFVVH